MNAAALKSGGLFAVSEIGLRLLGEGAGLCALSAGARSGIIAALAEKSDGLFALGGRLPGGSGVRALDAKSGGL